MPENADHNAPGHHTHSEGHAHGDPEPARAAEFLHGLWVRFTHALPHSHDAASSVDDALTSSSEGMSALKISVLILSLTGGLQTRRLIVSGSVALLADTIHNLADALTAVPLAVAFRMGSRPATQRYTYGYGRAEDLAGVSILLIVLAAAVLAGYAAIHRLIHPAPLTHVGWVAAAGAVGFVGNEIVARYRIVVGRRIGSAALEADGLHARTDGLSSLGVVGAATGFALGWRYADPVFGIVITIAILAVVRTTVRDIYRRLMDAVDPRIAAQAQQVLVETPGIRGIDALRVRWIGHRLHVDAEIAADGFVTLADAHDIAEVAKHRLFHELANLGSVAIHVSPVVADGRDPHALTAHHRDPLRRGTTS